MAQASQFFQGISTNIYVYTTSSIKIIRIMILWQFKNEETNNVLCGHLWEMRICSLILISHKWPDKNTAYNLHAKDIPVCVELCSDAL